MTGDDYIAPVAALPVTAPLTPTASTDGEGREGGGRTRERLCSKSWLLASGYS